MEILIKSLNKNPTLFSRTTLGEIKHKNTHIKWLKQKSTIPITIGIYL